MTEEEFRSRVVLPVRNETEMKREIDEVTAIAVDPGNAYADHYMRGMANGLILAQAIVHGKEPEYIDADKVPAPLDYMAAADRTCSIVFRPDFVDKGEFVNLLSSFATIAEALNLRKKLFFRGKTPDDVGLYHPPLHASLAVEFDANNPQDGEIDILHGCIGIITEAGEVAELLLRRLASGSFDAINVLEEAGDIRWYIVRLMRGIGATDEICERANIDKLQGRHGEAFDVFRDANRDLDTERKRLERAKTIDAAELFETANRLDGGKGYADAINEAAEKLAANIGEAEQGEDEKNLFYDKRMGIERTYAKDATGQDTPGPCLGDNIHLPPEPGLMWDDGCWRRAFVRDVPGLA